MIAVILAFIIGAVFGALGIMITVIAIADRDKNQDGKWWE